MLLNWQCHGWRWFLICRTPRAGLLPTVCADMCCVEEEKKLRIACSWTVIWKSLYEIVCVFLHQCWRPYAVTMASQWSCFGLATEDLAGEIVDHWMPTEAEFWSECGRRGWLKSKIWRRKYTSDLFLRVHLVNETWIPFTKDVQEKWDLL